MPTRRVPRIALEGRTACAALSVARLVAEGSSQVTWDTGLGEPGDLWVRIRLRSVHDPYEAFDSAKAPEHLFGNEAMARVVKVVAVVGEDATRGVVGIVRLPVGDERFAEVVDGDLLF